LQLTELLLFLEELRDICEWLVAECEGLESTDRLAGLLAGNMLGPLAKGLGVTVSIGWTLPVTQNTPANKVDIANTCPKAENYLLFTQTNIWNKPFEILSKFHFF